MTTLVMRLPLPMRLRFQATLLFLQALLMDLYEYGEETIRNWTIPLPRWTANFWTRSKLFRKYLYIDAAGNVQMRIGAIILGVITIVIGLVLSGVVIDTAASSGGNNSIGSFSGAGAINNLIPLIYFVVIVMVAVGMIGIGAAGFAGRGPLR